jgi:hypothetical protein
VAWRVGAQGKALQWWQQRLSDQDVVAGLLASVSRLHAAGGMPD